MRLRFVGRRLLTLTLALAISCTHVLVVGVPVTFAACVKQWAYDVVTPSVVSDGGRMTWALRDLHADDWAAGGFASEVLWVGTDSDPNRSNPNTWVEVGVTHGWQGQNVYTYYLARGDGALYSEARITSITPQVGAIHTFSGFRTSGPSLYNVSIDTTAITLSPHVPDTKWFQGGLESTCDSSRVDNTYVSLIRQRRESDAYWLPVSQGSLGKEPSNGVGSVAWCTNPSSFRYSLHSQVPLACQ